MRRQPQGLVPRLAPAGPVGVGAFPVGVEDIAVRPLEAPQPIEEGPRLGELRVLAGQPLRLGPVDAEDLRAAGFHRRAILVESPLLRPALIIPGGLEITAA